MAVEIQHDGPNKFALAGLDLNVPVDLVPVGKYSRATNVVSRIEGRLETRNGSAQIFQIPNPLIGTSYPITSAFRTFSPTVTWTPTNPIPDLTGATVNITGCSNPLYNGTFTVQANFPPSFSTDTNSGNVPTSSSSTGGTMTVVAMPSSPAVNTLFRLTQYVPSVIGERLAGAADGNLYSAPLPAGNVFTQLLGGPTFDGAPLSIVQFRFSADPAVWAIIANSQGMMKRRAGFYQALGVAPPLSIAVATAGGTGLLNSTSGTPYDWRYTYLNPVTQSESNPSPVMVTSVISRPTTFTNNGYTNPGNAIDGNTTTYANCTNTASGPFTSQRGCTWQATAANSAGLLSLLRLDISRALTAQASGSGNLSALLQYSLDGGVTFITIENVNLVNNTFVSSQTTISANLPVGTDFTQLVIRSTLSVTQGNGPTGAATVTSLIYDINLTAYAVDGTVITLSLVNKSANVCVTPPTDPQETSIRLYRRGGTLPNNWFFVGEFPVASLSQGSCSAGTLLINDNVPDSVAEIGNILSIDNYQPIQSVQATNFPLPVIFPSPSTGRLLGCGDPARPDSVYFSAPGNADIWPAENWVVVANPGEQCMNGLDYNLRTFVFSREQMYIMLPNIVAGVTFTPAETSCRHGLKGRWAFTKGEQGIYFVSKDGIYRTQGGPEQSIIDDSIRPLFPVREGQTGTPTNGYDAIDMDDEDGLRLTYHNGEIWFFYTGLTLGMRQILIYDERRSRWRAAIYTNQMNMAYSEPNTDSSLLFGGTDGDIYNVSGQTDENNASIPVEFTTGAMDQGRPLNLKEYMTVNFDVDPGGATDTNPILIVPRINGETATEFTLEIYGSGRQRFTLPLNQAGAEVYAYNIEFNISWNASATVNPIFYQYEILYRHEPAEVTHFHVPASSLGMEGWFHIRDGYLTLRSTQPVTLTVTPTSGAAQTFILPSTGGRKQKLYFQLASNKAKSFEFDVDSSAPFRIYADESELRVKQWLTNIGYKNIPIIAREQVGRPFGQVNV